MLAIVTSIRTQFIVTSVPLQDCDGRTFYEKFLSRAGKRMGKTGQGKPDI